MYKNGLKRSLDFLIALFGIILLSPFFIVITIALWIDFQGNPFFRQDRPGKNEKIFNILKFKTMNDKKDDDGNLLPDNQRITKMGRLIRKTSLDEIPQLFNILMGDMSLVGPRPLRTFYLPYYNEVEKLRHTVRPGITGLAQISGRNYLTWEERFGMDVEYVRNMSLSMDFKILVETFKKAVTGKDVAEDPDAFIEHFDSYRKKQMSEGIFSSNQDQVVE
ncbi:Sugar transferase involved in LPS biosynthesis (colanic, teichoic acid) [Flagellimonas taeanensis]|uniref:Sugar transferase involved in LPS biosynthesis (Colanic, teichoic acid) n=1 Tax=Flagellimonas taeanensis TaxID=1005926 RepID=A0A1M6V1H2_9FLAO|nr:sugar transferase [Allomuricauda taeanensis]SFC21414.1 Sugar transferase involved in LPS biosynthesis (colanic, teichoic acid) [Allomuricauda taeanensis]SHK75303.1 Sugar transferase involved in LPS biosynthesis (colanic, teichoic acid) [Allomuricauda taeanensis]